MQEKEKKKKEKHTVYNARSKKQKFLFPTLLKETSLKKKRKKY